MTFATCIVRGCGWWEVHWDYIDFCNKWIYTKRVYSIARKLWSKGMVFGGQKVLLRKVQGVFGRSKFGPIRNFKNRLVLLDSGNQKNTKLWVAKVLLLFRMQVKQWEDEKNLLFPIHEYQPTTIKRGWGIEMWKSAVKYWRRRRSYVRKNIVRFLWAATERDGVVLRIEPFRSIRGVMHVMREKFGVAPFIDELAWQLRRFYI